MSAARSARPHAETIVRIMVGLAGRAGAPVVGFVSSGGARMQEGVGRARRLRTDLPRDGAAVGARSPDLDHHGALRRRRCLLARADRLGAHDPGVEHVPDRSARGPRCARRAGQRHRARWHTCPRAQRGLLVRGRAMTATRPTSPGTCSAIFPPAPGRDAAPAGLPLGRPRSGPIRLRPGAGPSPGLRRTRGDPLPGRRGRVAGGGRRRARNMVTGFARIDGRAVGVIANQPRHLGGVLDAGEVAEGSPVRRAMRRVRDAAGDARRHARVHARHAARRTPG